MTCAALVLFMTLPGLAFLWRLVRAKTSCRSWRNASHAAGYDSLVAVGYSLVFHMGRRFSGLKFAFFARRCAAKRRLLTGLAKCLRHVSAYVRNHYAALIIGAIAERMKFADGSFRRGLDVRVYFQCAHGLGNRWLYEWRMESGRRKITAIDFAGDSSPHVLRCRRLFFASFWTPIGFKKEVMAPHAWCFAWLDRLALGAGTVYAVDALASDESRQTRSCNNARHRGCSFTWAMLEYALRGKRACSILFRRVRRPGCHHAGAICRSNWESSLGCRADRSIFACTKLKSLLATMTALDTFGITPWAERSEHFHWLLATASVNPKSSLRALPRLSIRPRKMASRKFGILLAEQLKAIAVTMLCLPLWEARLSAQSSGLIGLRIAPEIERQGLDINQHGEEGI